MLNLPISDIMNDHPIKVKADVSIRNVAHLMLRYRINGILAVDPKDPEWLLGVFTTRELLDILGEALSKGSRKMQALHDVGERPVSEFLGKEEMVILQVTDNAARAVALMHKKNAITMPVFDGGKLVGVVGRHDIINIAFA
ncbi:MAG: CBS domain-containing protein [Candidatus Omnitrophica bacterium]|nr:CBS domain-containing protein [Candidatus Omnitrophota bacterium]